MSLLRSWFQGQSSSASDPSWLPPSDGPRTGLLNVTPEPQRTSSPASQSSTSRSPNTNRPSRPLSNRPADPLISLQRYEADIQRHLQSLLDAQSDGLVAGIGGGDGGDFDNQSESDAASSSHARSPELGKVLPIRQPAQKPLGLSGARRGIKRAIRELTIIKQREDDMYVQELRSNSEAMGRIGDWKERRTGLVKEVEEIRSGDGGSRMEDLQKESKALQEQITAMENQLMELRSQHNAVKSELSRIENSVQSKLSSYTASLNMLDKEVMNFLARPAQHPQRTTVNESAYLTLPARRRTLEMARAHLVEERKALEQRQESTREGKTALEEGLVVWEDTMQAVTRFERDLKRSIQAFDPSVTPDQGKPANMTELLEQMDQLLTNLDSKVRLAEARGWKLLVCCIGAELEALRQGRKILDAAQSSSEKQQSLNEVEDTEEPRRASVTDLTAESPIRRSADSFRRRNEWTAPLPYRPEDDEPDPELLISRQDTDTE